MQTQDRDSLFPKEIAVFGYPGLGRGLTTLGLPAGAETAMYVRADVVDDLLMQLDAAHVSRRAAVRAGVDAVRRASVAQNAVDNLLGVAAEYSLEITRLRQIVANCVCQTFRRRS